MWWQCKNIRGCYCKHAILDFFFYLFELLQLISEIVSNYAKFLIVCRIIISHIVISFKSYAN